MTLDDESLSLYNSKSIPQADRKGVFSPSGLFIRLGWPKNLSDEAYLPYLITLAHEQFHYLQYIGTSFGQFLLDIEDIWVNDIIKNIQDALQISEASTFSIEDWAQNETNQLVKDNLNKSISLYNCCKSINEITINGGSDSDLHEFIKLYHLLLEYQEKNPNAIWLVNQEKKPVAFKGELPSRYFSSYSVMECVAAFRQKEYIGKFDQNDSRLFSIPERMRRGFLNEKGQDDSIEATESSIFGDYFEPFGQISGYLPEDLNEAIKILFIISDLALMPPIGRFNSLATRPPTFGDLIPSLRLIKAAEAIDRLDIKVKNIKEDYSKVVEAICIDLDVIWPQPAWIAMKAPKLLIGHDTRYKMISDLELLAYKYRVEDPSAFAFPAAPLINDMKIPVIFYADGGLKTGVPQNTLQDLNRRYLRKLCAETWLLGARPKILDELTIFSEPYELGFERIFGISPPEM